MLKSPMAEIMRKLGPRPITSNSIPPSSTATRLPTRIPPLNTPIRRPRLPSSPSSNTTR